MLKKRPSSLNHNEVESGCCNSGLGPIKFSGSLRKRECGLGTFAEIGRQEDQINYQANPTPKNRYIEKWGLVEIISGEAQRCRLSATLLRAKFGNRKDNTDR